MHQVVVHSSCNSLLPSRTAHRQQTLHSPSRTYTCSPLRHKWHPRPIIPIPPPAPPAPPQHQHHPHSHAHHTSQPPVGSPVVGSLLLSLLMFMTLILHTYYHCTDCYTVGIYSIYHDALGCKSSALGQARPTRNEGPSTILLPRLIKSPL
jgi:hypothetical protein